MRDRAAGLGDLPLLLCHQTPAEISHPRKSFSPKDFGALGSVDRENRW